MVKTVFSAEGLVMFRFLVAALTSGVIFSAAHADPEKQELNRQRDKQKEVRAETDHVVRRTSTMLRVFDYYKLDNSAEKRLLDEVAGTLAGLSKEQMADVIARLEKAANNADAVQARTDVDQAHAQHREILVRLKELLRRYEAVKTLDQAAERLQKAAKTQLELQLQTSQLVQDVKDVQQGRRTAERKSRQALESDIKHEAEEQRDLQRDVAQTLKQLDGLKAELPPEELQRLQQAQALAKNDRLLEKMDEAADQLRGREPREQSWKSATGKQRQAAADLQDVARALRIPNDKLNALREARDRIDRALDKQETLRADANAQKDPRIRDHEKLQRKETPNRRAQEMGDQQARLAHDTRDVQNLLKPHADSLAETIKPAPEAMHKAEDALRNRAAAEAVKPQSEAVNTLDDVRNKLDRMIAQEEKRQSDPLAALQKTAEDIERLIKEQKDARNKTREAAETNHPERLAPLAKKQEALTKRADDLRQQPIPAKPKATAALDKAARAMDDARKELQHKKGAEAVPNQDEAVKSLEQAQKQLGEQIAEIEKRREDIAALDEASNKLDELTRKQGKLGEQATEMAQKNQQAGAKELAKEQGELTPQAKEVGKQLDQAAPEAAEHVAKSAQEMDAAKKNLDDKALSPAAKKAAGAAKELRQAQKALSKALAEKTGMEIADQAVMEQGKVDPANAAQQIAKALEQAKRAADNSEQAAEKLGKSDAQPTAKSRAEAKQALARSQDANEGAMTALEQAEALAPEAVQPQLQKAGQELGKASEQLGQGTPEPANQAQKEAVAQLSKALQSLNEALAAMGQPQSPHGRPSPALASAQQPRPGQKPGQGQGKTQKPTQAQERNQAKGGGNRVASAAPQSAPSQLKAMNGDGSFLSLPPRQREMIRQALTGKLPPEYAAMIQQYYINLAGGKPAAKQSGPDRR